VNPAAKSKSPPRIITAVTEKISAFTAESYLRSRAEHASPAAFQAILDRVRQRAPMPGDE